MESTSGLTDLTQRTLQHYDSTAEQFFAGTIDHDVSQNIAALLEAITVPAPLDLLDLGCGPGRDLKTFTSMGHRAIGIDGAARFVEMARAFSGCEVWRQDFVDLSIPAAAFDGIYANASLFHVPGAALAQVLRMLFAGLRPGGVLFSSNPRGDNREGWNGPRYGNYHDYAGWKAHLEAVGFVEVRHYYRPHGLPREQQPWLASVWRKPR
ncbi:MAG: class I SAM-dependent methyltransferase [Sphingomonadaceae bacterium]